MIEFEYVQIYINSIVLQAMTDTENASTVPAEEDTRSIQILISSSRTVNSLLAEGVQQGILLENAEVRTYLRGFTALTFLLKVCCFSIIILT